MNHNNKPARVAQNGVARFFQNTPGCDYRDCWQARLSALASIRLRAVIKKETRFNEQVILNTKIKALEAEKQTAIHALNTN